MATESLPCPYCKGVARKVDSARVYGRSFGEIYLCENYPRCDAFVGTNKRNGEPLGTLADHALREKRKAAHASFDPLWQGGQVSRSEAYARLSSYMGLPSDKTHIGMFNIEQCDTVLAFVRGTDPQTKTDDKKESDTHARR